MKNIFLFLLCIMLHTVVFAQISESELIGKRFEICHDGGGLDGCAKTARLIFTNNAMGDISLNINGFFDGTSAPNSIYEGKFIYEIFAEKYIFIQTIPQTFYGSILSKEFLNKSMEMLTEAERQKFTIGYAYKNTWAMVFEAEKTPQGNYILKMNVLSEMSPKGIIKKVKKLEMKKF